MIETERPLISQDPLFTDTNIQRKLDHIHGHILSSEYTADPFEVLLSFSFVPDQVQLIC